MNKYSWTVGLACSFVIAFGSSRAEARDIPIKGDVAGTSLTARIDLDNFGGPADWVTQQFWASEKVEEPRGIKVGSYCA
jgi:hypothetical protein